METHQITDHHTFELITVLDGLFDLEHFHWAAGDSKIEIRGFDLTEDPLRKAFAPFGGIVSLAIEERRR